MVDGMRFWRATQKGKRRTWKVTELDICNNRRRNQVSLAAIDIDRMNIFDWIIYGWPSLELQGVVHRDGCEYRWRIRVWVSNSADFFRGSHQITLKIQHGCQNLALVTDYLGVVHRELYSSFMNFVVVCFLCFILFYSASLSC